MKTGYNPYFLSMHAEFSPQRRKHGVYKDLVVRKFEKRLSANPQIALLDISGNKLPFLFHQSKEI